MSLATSAVHTLDPSGWVDQHGDVLYRFALARLRDPGLAESAVQETFVSALRARESFAGRASERTWLTGILKRKVIDHFRRTAREVPLEAEDTTDALFDASGQWRAPPADWGDDPGSALERSELRGRLQVCLDELPPRLARAFLLREVDDVPAPEVCEALQVTPANLWVLLHRARSRLRHCLELAGLGSWKEACGC